MVELKYYGSLKLAIEISPVVTVGFVQGFFCKMCSEIFMIFWIQLDLRTSQQKEI